MEDTIAAIATAYGEGGIGIVRISGEKAFDILTQIFMPIKKHREKKLFYPDSVGETIGVPIVNRQLHYGKIIDKKTETVIDEVLAVYMKAPYTYTTEDVVEINCHGSIVALQAVLSLVLSCGARLAERGEFTKRAFLNGRLDLSQAEAVMDLISAKTQKGFQVAMNQMEGSLSKKIKEIRNELLDLLVQISVNLDYPDEDIEELTYEKQLKCLMLIYDQIEMLIGSAKVGRMIKEGIKVTIIGKPNVGKSSLMNAFLKEARAIVTEIPGTTRDIISEALTIEGIPIILTDTAGIRDTDNVIEKLGIEKSKESFNRADLVLFMLNGNSPLTVEDQEIMDCVDEKKTVVLVNKADLNPVLTKEEIRARLPEAKIIHTSMKTEEGLAELAKHILALVYGGKVAQEDSTLVTNVRHLSLLEKAKTSIDDAINSTKMKAAMDFTEVDIREAYDSLGEMIGDTAKDDIINQVFKQFCLGK